MFQLRHLAIKLFVFQAIAIALPKANAATVDYTGNLSARSYSEGLSIDPTVGVTQVVWGDSSTPFHGYIRPSVSALVSPTILGGKTALDIYPLSFLGMTVARNRTHRYLKAQSYDCENGRCLGALDSSEISFKFMSAYQDYFLVARYQRIFFDDSGGEQPVVDPVFALEYKAGGSNLNIANLILGKKLDGGLSAGVLVQSGTLDRDANASESDYVFLRSELEKYGYSKLALTVGLGRFQTQIKRPGFSAVAILSFKDGE